MASEPTIPHLTTVRWLSFARDVTSLDKLSIWQAIALVLAECDSPDMDEYIEAIDRIERLIAAELAEVHDAPPITINPAKPEQLEILTLERADRAFLAANDRGAILRKLDDERLDSIHQLIHAQFVHRILIAEADRYFSGEAGELDVSYANSVKGIDGLFLFRRATLTKWNSIGLLKSLGLSGLRKPESKRRVRADKIENCQHVLGALCRLIARQFPTELAMANDRATVNVSAMRTWLMRNVNHRKGTDFPELRNCHTILSESIKQFDGIGSLRPDIFSPE